MADEVALIDGPESDPSRAPSSDAPLCGCGLPMSKNPHPDAGKPDQDGVEAGYAWECIPCLVATRNRVGKSWRKAEAEIDGLRRLVAIADRMFAENHAEEQAKSDASYIKEFGHNGPHLAGALGSAGREYVYHRHRIGEEHGLPNAMDALGQRGGSDRVGADVYERELQRHIGPDTNRKSEP